MTLLTLFSLSLQGNICSLRNVSNGQEIRAAVRRVPYHLFSGRFPTARKRVHRLLQPYRLLANSGVLHLNLLVSLPAAVWFAPHTSFYNSRFSPCCANCICAASSRSSFSSLSSDSYSFCLSLKKRKVIRAFSSIPFGVRQYA